MSSSFLACNSRLHSVCHPKIERRKKEKKLHVIGPATVKAVFQKTVCGTTLHCFKSEVMTMMTAIRWARTCPICMVQSFYQALEQIWSDHFPRSPITLMQTESMVTAIPAENSQIINFCKSHYHSRDMVKLDVDKYNECHIIIRASNIIISPNKSS